MSALFYFYLQDSRSYVGNDMLWWCKTGGYTTDLSKAGLYSLEGAQRQHDMRPTDIPWPKEYIDSKVRPAVDHQYVKRKEVSDCGIVLQKPKSKAEDQLRCHGCQRFTTLESYFDCPHCGFDNRP